MKWMWIFVILNLAAMLFAEAKPEKLHSDRTWGYFEMGKGALKGKNILSVNGGVSYELNQRICFTIYKAMHEDDREFMSDYPAKYSFHGHGVLIGPVFKHGKFKFIPSAGIEFGTMSVGENLYYDDSVFFPSYHWQNVNKETVTFLPLSLLGKFNYTDFLAFRGKLGINIHKTYPLVNVSLGICVGRL